MIGHTIARRYRLLEVIGQGGYCVVYRAVDLHLLDEVAVKLLNEEHVRDTGFIERMSREYTALDALRGTAAPAVHAFHRDRGVVFLVMELLTGREFGEYLKEVEAAGSTLPFESFVRCLEPVVYTLELAHRRGIVHRDLKPANIFVLDGLDDLGVRLLDFGLATVTSHRKITGPGMVIGSPSYIAPEMWQGSAHLADHRADVYSMGAILFRALTGKVPFAGESMHDKLRAATTAARPRPRDFRADLPESLDAWTRQALAIDPAERFARVGAMWVALLDSLGVSRGRYREAIGEA